MKKKINQNSIQFVKYLDCCCLGQLYSWWCIWYVEINFAERKQTIVLSQGRTYDYRRFKEKIGELDSGDVRKIINGYEKLHSFEKNRPPAISDKSRG